ncbi:dimethylarginine dimethylaminohydrolase family protein [Flagellimonas onchidii]|uniref:dimethylarginine dimethylaminohydrolase family protein n=1 Tax=Flagellimonas onchidii TaxID=2562684 RepID=UPI0010A68F80|nr:arginine deiminase family protein [Allomuricauda onchidii]
MLNLHVVDETSPLKAVILGTAESCGPTPRPEEAYDPKSLEHILAGTYPKEEDMLIEMDAFAKVFKKYEVKVFRPSVLQDCNQIFSRDIAFVIEDKLFHSNILPDREREYEAIQHVLDQIDPNKIIRPPEKVHIEGGDVMPWNDYIFVGTYTGPDYPDYITARTNKEAVEFLKEQFPNKKVKAFELRKSNTIAKENALHLDCCFQPVGKDKAILHKNGFLVEEEYQWLMDYFGKENIFEITKDEMYQMFSNVFSISPEVVVSEKGFTRLNKWLREQGFTVEEIPYAEIAKQEGLLRCSTMPLIRE